MKIREFLGKFKSMKLWGNLAAMALVIVLLAVGFKFAIDIYTHHGESIEVPDIVHKGYAQSLVRMESLGLEVQVSDTGYVRTLPPGCILEQFPAAGEHVKAGHVIYVTINATHTPVLTIPDVIDNCSLREAMARLTALGFSLTPPEFIAGEKDWVYGITVNGRHVSFGDKVPVDAHLTIQVGNGMLDDNDSVDYVNPMFNDDTDEGDIDEFEEVSPEEEERSSDAPAAHEQQAAPPATEQHHD